MVYRIAAVPKTLSDLQVIHKLQAFLNATLRAAADMTSTASASRGPSALAQLPVVNYSGHKETLVNRN